MSEKENKDLENSSPEANEEAPEVKETEAPKVKRRTVNPRKFKHGTLSVVLTVVFIAAVVALNVIVAIISERVNTAADLTAGGIYSLDEKTQQYLRDTLDGDVTVTVLNTEQKFVDGGMSYKQINEVLKRMEMETSHISVEYLDIDQNPNFTSRFKGETLQANYIVVESEKTERHRIISPYDYFTFDEQYLAYGAYYVTGSNIEQEAVSAMMYTTNDKPVRVAFTKGYNEGDSAAFQTLLSKNGYDVEEVNLTTSDIDDNVDYVVVYAPKIDMDKSALSKLDRFLDNNSDFGKNVMYFASCEQPETPNIDEFLRDWGLSVGFDVIGQTNSEYTVNSLDLFIHLQQLCDTDYTKSVSGTNLFTIGADIRPVYLLDSGTADRTVLLKTYDGAYLYPLDTEKAEDFDYTKVQSGKYNDLVLSSRGTESGVYSNLLVCGSEHFVSSLIMSYYNNSNNADLFVGIFNHISGREQGMTVKSKSFSPVSFEMNVKTANTLSVVLCIIVPVAVIVLGIVIWVRRRHR